MVKLIIESGNTITLYYVRVLSLSQEAKMNAMLMMTILAAAVAGTCKYDLPVIHTFLRFSSQIKRANN